MLVILHLIRESVAYRFVFMLPQNHLELPQSHPQVTAAIKSYSLVSLSTFWLKHLGTNIGSDRCVRTVVKVCNGVGVEMMCSIVLDIVLISLYSVARKTNM